MAKASLAVHPLSRNDISIIAKLLEQSFDYYLNHISPFYSDYLCSLRTVVGLGYTAVLTDTFKLSTYQRYLNCFIEQKKGDFRKAEGAKKLIAQVTAEMVGTAVSSFKVLRYPLYYGEFVKALHHTIATVPRLTIANNEADRIISRLMVN